MERYQSPQQFVVMSGSRHASPAMRHASPAMRHASPAMRHASPAMRHASPTVHFRPTAQPVVMQPLNEAPKVGTKTLVPVFEHANCKHASIPPAMLPCM